jgi:hypothetical protein
VNETGFPAPSLPPAPSAGIAPAELAPEGTTLPGGVPLGTMPRGSKTFGQLLDRLFQLMRAHWRLIVGIALVPGAGVIFYFGVMFAAFFPVMKPLMLHQTVGFSPMAMVWLSAANILGMILMILVSALYEPAAAYAALNANTGTRVTFGNSWAVAWSNAGRYIWLSILRALIVTAPILVFGVLFVGSVALSLAHGRVATNSSAMVAIFPLILLFYLGAMVYAVLVMLRLVLAVPACVAEDVSAWKGIRRSNQLTHGAKGRIFLLALLIYAIGYAAFLVAEMVIFFLGAMVALVGMLLHVAMAPWGYIGIGVGAVIFLCAYLFWLALIAGAYQTLFAMVYQDQRLRLEGAAAAQA